VVSFEQVLLLGKLIMSVEQIMASYMAEESALNNITVEERGFISRGFSYLWIRVTHW
jgi:hypothetical protein